ncbi:MAG: hypothetical protein OIF57_11975 [Marinobacterium sp.]|nr:hypothetical protein [Marinobacterium sp.]
MSIKGAVGAVATGAPALWLVAQGAGNEGWGLAAGVTAGAVGWHVAKSGHLLALLISVVVCLVCA